MDGGGVMDGGMAILKHQWNEIKNIEKVGVNLGQFKLISQLIDECNEDELIYLLADKGVKEANSIAKQYILESNGEIGESMKIFSRETDENLKSKKLSTSFHKSRGL